MKKLEDYKIYRHGLAVVSMLIVSFAWAPADARAEQLAAAQMRHWPAEKILPLSPAAKPVGAASTTRNISPHIRGRRSRS